MAAVDRQQTFETWKVDVDVAAIVADAADSLDEEVAEAAAMEADRCTSTVMT